MKETAEGYLRAVKRNGMKLYFVPIKYQTMEVCTAAVERRLKEAADILNKEGA